jgi:3-oxoacyl-[acyl-carrier-protein] synthase II
MACPVQDGEWLDQFSVADRRRLDRIVLLGLAAANQAAHAELLSMVAPRRRSVVSGIGFGGISTLTSQHKLMLESGHRRLSPFGIPTIMTSALSAFASLRYEVRGPMMTVSSACASGGQAIAEAGRLIRDGSADLVLAGGAEAPLDVLTVAGFSRMEALASSANELNGLARPFDVSRGGFTIGEGAAFLVIVGDDIAEAHSLPVQGELLGWSVSSDAHHITAPPEDGSTAEECIRTAIEHAGLLPSDIKSVNAHGTGTRLNDQAEATALTKIFGPEAIPVTSVKGAIGHLLGGAGAVEAVAAVRSAQTGLVPPTVGCEHVDPALPVDVVKDAPRHVGSGPVISCSFGFGGQNVALVIAPC